MNIDGMPAAINILGSVYSVEYVDNPSEVDIFKREAVWGQIDYWTRTIRIFARDFAQSDIWKSIIHEVLHGIGQELKITMLQNQDNHDELDVLAVALVDTFIRNDWLTTGEGVE